MKEITDGEQLLSLVHHDVQIHPPPDQFPIWFGPLQTRGEMIDGRQIAAGTERQKENKQKGTGEESQIKTYPLEQTLHQNVLTPTSVRDAARQLMAPDLPQLSSRSFKHAGTEITAPVWAWGQRVVHCRGKHEAGFELQSWESRVANVKVWG
ncbi:hypothetical protein KUDE01_014937 [Dissostichus eleginoides]|uniref:Uncharacterized protein n=1 Tax=Dissostichus eleginoides TaxID=100907 RepID=A0AAD9BWY4_DISEL|nr:hypothetical protein KUDE01_014937 [Dissostichus eleginoides]